MYIIVLNNFAKKTSGKFEKKVYMVHLSSTLQNNYLAKFLFIDFSFDNCF